MSTTIPTIEELEAETAGLNTHQLHQLSIKTRAELALARARIAESKGQYASGVVVPKGDIAAMNMAEKVLKARSCQIELIYARRHEQRSISEHHRLETENARLREQLKHYQENYTQKQP
jgi:hypothetical protein